MDLGPVWWTTHRALIGELKKPERDTGALALIEECAVAVPGVPAVENKAPSASTGHGSGRGPRRSSPLTLRTRPSLWVVGETLAVGAAAPVRPDQGGKSVR